MTDDEIHLICEEYNIINYNIDEDGFVDVKGDVKLYERNLTKLPLKFGKVAGHFNCRGNFLTSLEGSPYYVGTNFLCSYNDLENLEGSPTHVGCTFECSTNKLVNLKGISIYIGGTFDCINNEHLENYTELLFVEIKKHIYIKDYFTPLTKQEILIIELNKVLLPYDIMIDINYNIQDITTDKIILKSNDVDLEQDVINLFK